MNIVKLICCLIFAVFFVFETITNIKNNYDEKYYCNKDKKIFDKFIAGFIILAIFWASIFIIKAINYF